MISQGGERCWNIIHGKDSSNCPKHSAGIFHNFTNNMVDVILYSNHYWYGGVVSQDTGELTWEGHSFQFRSDNELT